MSFSNLLGTIGVTLLLIAFFLNLFKYITQDSKSYLILNIVGAAMTCYASYIISFIPFVILEATWTAVSAVGLVRSFNK